MKNKNMIPNQPNPSSARHSEQLVSAVFAVILFLGFALLIRISNTIALIRADALEFHPLGPPFSLPFLLGEELLFGVFMGIVLYKFHNNRLMRYFWISLIGIYLLCLAADQMAFKIYFTHIDYVLFSSSREITNLSSSIADTLDWHLGFHVLCALCITAILFSPFRPGFIRRLSSKIRYHSKPWIAAGIVYIALTGGLNAAVEQHGLARSFPVAYVLSFLNAGAEAAEIAHIMADLEKEEQQTKASPKQAQASKAPLKDTAPKEIDVKPKRKFNVVWYMLESTSLRESSLAPNPAYDTTPFLAKLAKDSLVFDNYYCVVAASTRSFFSALSGIYPYMDRLSDLTPYSQLNIPTLPDILHAEEYATAIFSSSDTMFESLDTFLSARKYDHIMDKNLVPPEQGGGVATNYWGVDEEVMIDKALAWVKEVHAENRPFYLNYNAVYPHHPFRVPDQHKHLYNEDWGKPTSKARFRASLRYADWALQKFIKGLEDLGVLEDTLVIVTPDHGETFGDLHSKNHIHAQYSYEEDSRIFLLLHNSQLIKNPGRNHHLGSHIDLLPTVLSILDLPIPDNLDGRDLLSEAFKERTMYFFSRKQLAIRKDNMKLLVSRDKGQGRNELYDLKTDPTEQNNLAGEHQALVKELKKEVKLWQAKVATGFKTRLKAQGLSKDEISQLAEKKRKARFASARVRFEKVVVCAGAGNTSCSPQKGTQTFKKGSPLTILAKISKPTSAKIRVTLFDQDGKGAYVKAVGTKGKRELVFPSISTTNLETGVLYRLRVQTVYFHAKHDTRWIRFYLAD